MLQADNKAPQNHSVWSVYQYNFFSALFARKFWYTRTHAIDNITITTIVSEMIKAMTLSSNVARFLRGTNVLVVSRAMMSRVVTMMMMIVRRDMKYGMFFKEKRQQV